MFLVAVLGTTAAAGLVYVVLQAPLPEQPSVDLLNQTTFLTDANGQRLATFHGSENRTVVHLAEVPQVVQDAVVATEDRNFFRHAGVDPVGLLRATWADLRSGGAVQGGSTITQQYVKNAYVGRDRSLWRKLKEAVIAIKLERKLTKRQILERYLNTIYFGRGAYGVQAASQAYFGKDVGRLGLPEAAYLAGIIKSPQAADPARDPQLARRNRHLTLVAMEKEHLVTSAQREAVDATVLYGPGGYVQSPAQLAAQTRVALTDKGTQYFVEYVRQFLIRRYGEDAVYGNGLRVRTTLDLKTQTQAYDAVYGLLDRPGDPSGALVALDENGRVKAMVGGRDWSASTPYAKVNLAVGKEGGGRGRQAGSTFKPFVLAEAVREGYSVESALPGPARITIPKADNGADWTVNNYEGEAFDKLNLIDATAQSVNTVYAQLIAALGPAKVADTARVMGLVTPLPPFPSIALGTTDVSVLEMTDAYLTLANRGVHAEPQVVSEVDDARGQVIEQFRPQKNRVIDRGQADVVNEVLRQVVDHGTGTAAQFGKPCAGKTGTTADYGDAWFIGYTPRLTAGVWMGYPEGQSRKMLDVHGRKVSGGSLPATIFRRFMSAAAAGVDTGDFPEVTRFPGRVLSADRLPFTIATSTTVAGPPTTRTTPAPPPTTAPAGSPPASSPSPTEPPTTQASGSPSTTTERAGGSTTTTQGVLPGPP